MATRLEINVRKLPPDQRAWFDGSAALPPQVRHLPAREPSVADAYPWAAFGLGSVVAGCIALFLCISRLGNPTLNRTGANLAAVELVVGVFAIMFAIGSVFGVLAVLWRIREQQRAPLRYGVFLDPAVLILRRRRSSCTVLPRESIVKAELVEERGLTGARPVGHITYRREGGGLAILRLPASLAAPKDLAALVQAISTWLASATGA